MKIVVARSGKVGAHMAKMLTREQHNIVITDQQEEHLAFACLGLEVLPVVGNIFSQNMIF